MNTQKGIVRVEAMGFVPLYQFHTSTVLMVESCDWLITVLVLECNLGSPAAGWIVHSAQTNLLVSIYVLTYLPHMPSFFLLFFYNFKTGKCSYLLQGGNGFGHDLFDRLPA